MKKRGYTLIELVAVMAILTILLGSGFTIVSIMRNIKEDVESNDAATEISSILSYGKAYCRKNKTSGEIVFDTVGNKITFKNNHKIIKSSQLSNSNRISIKTSGSNIIIISEDGYLKKACSIIVKCKGADKVITISVGVDKVSVKDGQELISKIEESE